VPAHYNEVGIMTEGEVKLQDAMGLNYVFSIGNGVPGFGMPQAMQAQGAQQISE
jgi:hypothetical protein